MYRRQRPKRRWPQGASGPLRTLTRREAPAVAKNSSSRSKAVEHTMSGAARPSPHFRFATTLFTCSTAFVKRTAIEAPNCRFPWMIDISPTLKADRPR